MITVTKRIEFDYGHRLLRHESKCAHVHGHRGAVEVTVTASELDSVGRVVDFGVIKELVGGWVDANLDHAFVVDQEDFIMRAFLEREEQKHFVLVGPPTAENLATLLLEEAARLLAPLSLQVTSIRFWETPTSYAEASWPGEA